MCSTNLLLFISLGLHWAGNPGTGRQHALLYGVLQQLVVSQVLLLLTVLSQSLVPSCCGNVMNERFTCYNNPRKSWVCRVEQLKGKAILSHVKGTEFKRRASHFGSKRSIAIRNVSFSVQMWHKNVSIRCTVLIQNALDSHDSRQVFKCDIN